MKMILRFSLALFLAVGCLSQASIVAGDKKKEKEPEKKKGLSKDVTVNGEISNVDVKDKSRKDSYCKTYTYKMTEGRTYVIDMKSTDVDSYLRLENPAGEEVAADDDGGGFPDARITYKAPKGGDYTIICTTFVPNTTGKFVLTVKESGAGGNDKDGDKDKKRELNPLPPQKTSVDAIAAPSIIDAVIRERPISDR